MRRGGIANKDPSSPSYRFTELQRGPPTQDVSPRLSVEPRGNEKRKHRGKKKKKKRARNPVLKTAAGTSCSSPRYSQSHMSPPERSSTVRVPPGPTQPRGTRAQRGAERSRAAPGAHAAPFAAGVPNGPKGLRVSPLAALHRPFPPLSGGS